MRYTEDQLLPLSALQHLLFCHRQCALIHIERLWADNRFTAEGNVMHEKAHSGDRETRPGVQIKRSLPVTSRSLGISGQCDVVEFHENGVVLPIEYKRGKPKAHRADDVQLCAQAICLEENLEVIITSGFLFYGQRKRRSEIVFDRVLRELTATTARKLHVLMASQRTPTARYESEKCDACSLVELCQPRSLKRESGVSSWFASQVSTSLAP